MKRWLCDRCYSKNQENMKFCPVCHKLRPAEQQLPQIRQSTRTVSYTAARSLRQGRIIAVMKAIISANIAVLFASLVRLLVLKGW